MKRKVILENLPIVGLSVPLLGSGGNRGAPWVRLGTDEIRVKGGIVVFVEADEGVELEPGEVTAGEAVRAVSQVMDQCWEMVLTKAKAKSDEVRLADQEARANAL